MIEFFEENDIQYFDISRFEELIRDISYKDERISRVRKIGPTNQLDNYVDLIIEYIEYLDICNENEKSFKIKKIITLCKAYKKIVGESNVQDIRDKNEIFVEW